MVDPSEHGYSSSLVKRLASSALAAMIAILGFAGTEALAATQTISSTPPPPRLSYDDGLESLASCPAVINANKGEPRGLTLDEAKSCEPNAAVAPDGHMHHDGIFIVPDALGGYMVTSRRTRYYSSTSVRHGLDAEASTYQYVVIDAGGWSNWTQAHITSESGNDVWWGTLDDAAAYNRYMFVGCDWIIQIGGRCTTGQTGTLYPVYPYYMNPWGDLYYVHPDNTAFEMGCRHYINAAEQWTDAWCYSNG